MMGAELTELQQRQQAFRASLQQKLRASRELKEQQRLTGEATWKAVTQKKVELIEKDLIFEKRMIGQERKRIEDVRNYYKQQCGYCEGEEGDGIGWFEKNLQRIGINTSEHSGTTSATITANSMKELYDKMQEKLPTQAQLEIEASKRMKEIRERKQATDIARKERERRQHRVRVEQQATQALAEEQRLASERAAKEAEEQAKSAQLEEEKEAKRLRKEAQWKEREEKHWVYAEKMDKDREEALEKMAKQAREERAQKLAEQSRLKNKDRRVVDEVSSDDDEEELGAEVHDFQHQNEQTMDRAVSTKRHQVPEAPPPGSRWGDIAAEAAPAEELVSIILEQGVAEYLFVKGIWRKYQTPEEQILRQMPQFSEALRGINQGMLKRSNRLGGVAQIVCRYSEEEAPEAHEAPDLPVFVLLDEGAACSFEGEELEKLTQDLNVEVLDPQKVLSDCRQLAQRPPEDDEGHAVARMRVLGQQYSRLPDGKSQAHFTLLVEMLYRQLEVLAARRWKPVKEPEPPEPPPDPKAKAKAAPKKKEEAPPPEEKPVDLGPWRPDAVLLLNMSVELLEHCAWEASLCGFASPLLRLVDTEDEKQAQVSAVLAPFWVEDGAPRLPQPPAPEQPQVTEEDAADPLEAAEEPAGAAPEEAAQEEAPAPVEEGQVETEEVAEAEVVEGKPKLAGVPLLVLNHLVLQHAEELLARYKPPAKVEEEGEEPAPAAPPTAQEEHPPEEPPPPDFLRPTEPSEPRLTGSAQDLVSALYGPVENSFHFSNAQVLSRVFSKPVTSQPSLAQAVDEEDQHEVIVRLIKDLVAIYKRDPPPASPEPEAGEAHESPSASPVPSASPTPEPPAEPHGEGEEGEQQGEEGAGEQAPEEEVEEQEEVPPEPVDEEKQLKTRLKQLWLRNTTGYVQNLKKLLLEVDAAATAYPTELVKLQRKFLTFLQRSDEKCQVVDDFIKTWAQRTHPYSKEELEAEIQDLSNRLWQVTDRRRADSIEEIKNLLEGGFWEQEASVFVRLGERLQVLEASRFKMTAAVLATAYGKESALQDLEPLPLSPPTSTEGLSSMESFTEWLSKRAESLTALEIAAVQDPSADAEAQAELEMALLAERGILARRARAVVGWVQRFLVGMREQYDEAFRRMDDWIRDRVIAENDALRATAKLFLSGAIDEGEEPASTASKMKSTKSITKGKAPVVTPAQLTRRRRRNAHKVIEARTLDVEIFHPCKIEVFGVTSGGPQSFLLQAPKSPSKSSSVRIEPPKASDFY